MRDPVLCNKFVKLLSSLLHKFVQSQDMRNYFKLRHYFYDLYSLDKPIAGPIIALETDFLPEMLITIKQLHFIDLAEQPEAMQEYEKVFNEKLLNTELDLINKIERYLQYVTQPNDIKRILTTFIAIFESLDE